MIGERIIREWNEAVEATSDQCPHGDLGPDEPTRLCPHCQTVIRRKDERAGACPECGGRLLSLAGRAMSTVYLIHFDAPLGDVSNPRGQARHYLGYTEALAARLEAHRSGNGSAIMAAVARRGITWRLARTWEGGRDLERRLKRWHNSPRLCPICRGEG